MTYKHEGMVAKAKALCNQPDFHNSMWLVKNGVPFDVAFGCSDDWRLAMLVKIAEFEGQDFDWQSMKFFKREGDAV